jgi:glycosyltransferase involved in cell wall biosynthesis
VREYRALIERRGLADRFSFLGFVPNARKLMPWVDAVVMPSLWEACPLQTMEALAGGAPYIGTDIPGVRELVESSPAIIVPPRDAAALAGAMETVLAAPDEARSRARAFAPTGRERFAVQASASGLERLYDEVLVRR